VRIDAFPHPVDPAVRQREIERVLIGDPAALRSGLVKPDEQLACLAVVRGKPTPEIGRAREEGWIYIRRSGNNCALLEED
jgi:hypothetical protein